MVMSSGIMIAVPDACTTRAPRSQPKPGANAARAVPTLNSDIASRNAPRVPRRWSRKPVAGMTTAIVSMKAVVSHWPVEAVIPISSMR